MNEKRKQRSPLRDPKNRSTRALRWALALNALVVCSSFASSGFAQQALIPITTVADLDMVRDSDCSGEAHAGYELMNDLDLSSIADWPSISMSGCVWRPRMGLRKPAASPCLAHQWRGVPRQRW